MVGERTTPGSRCALALVTLIAACSGASEAPRGPEPERPEREPSGTGPTLPVAVTPPCTGSDAGGPLLAFSLHGTHGADFQESMVIGCDGEVVIEAEVPISGALVDRPGTHRARLDPARLPSLRDLAARLAQPVPMPSLPPQGADMFVSSGTMPPLSRPLRPGEGSADGEAAALYEGLLDELLASVPVCTVALALEEGAGPTLRAGERGLVLLRLRNESARPVYVGFVPESVEVRTAEGTDPREDASAPLMFLDPETVRGFDPFYDRPALGPGATVVAAIAIVPPAAPSLTLTAELRGEVTCEPPSERTAPLHGPHTRRFAAPPRTFAIAP